MTATKFKKDSEEFEMFQDYWNMIQEYWNPENTESYWKKAIDGSRRFYEKYKTPFAKGLAIAFMEELERKSKNANRDKF